MAILLLIFRKEKSHKSSSRHSRSDRGLERDKDEGKRSGGPKSEAGEIAAMNELRASLGMGPLK